MNCLLHINKTIDSDYWGAKLQSNNITSQQGKKIPTNKLETCHVPPDSLGLSFSEEILQSWTDNLVGRESASKSHSKPFLPILLPKAVEIKIYFLKVILFL